MMRPQRGKTRTYGVTRVLLVLLAWIMLATSLSVPASAADPAVTERVVGNPNGAANPPSHGVDAIPAEGSSGSSDIRVEVVDQLSRYAVDLEYDPSELTVSFSGKVWNVNDLVYVAADPNQNDQKYANGKRINMKLVNYSDLAVQASGDAVQQYQNAGYTLTAPRAIRIDGVVDADGDSVGAGIPGDLVFTLTIPSLLGMLDGLEKEAPDVTDGNYTLGTITVTVSPADNS